MRVCFLFECVAVLAYFYFPFGFCQTVSFLWLLFAAGCRSLQNEMIICLLTINFSYYDMDDIYRDDDDTSYL